MIPVDIIEKCKLLKQLVSQTIDLCCYKKSNAEVLICQTTGINIKVRYGKIENIEFNNDNFLNITVYKNNHKGSASSTDLSLKSIKFVVQAAQNIANYTSSDLCLDIADINLLAFQIPELDLYHHWNNDINYAVNLAKRAENSALNIDKRIVNTEGSDFINTIGIKVFGNTHGMLQSYYFSKYYLSSCVVAEQNDSMERDYEYAIGRSIEDLNNPEDIGKKCAHRVLSRLSPKKIFSQKIPVIFSAQISSTLFKHLINAIDGMNVYKKSTFLLNSLEKRIFPKWFDIIEYPHILKGLGSAPFDNEGILSKEIEIIKKGILKTWLLNTYTSRKLGFKNTGHANGIYNWIVSYQKNISFKELLINMKTGLLITELMGNGVNIINGDYSRGVTGFWIQNGEIQYPVSEITIAGNLKNMWKYIVNISNDIEKRSNIQCGSILIEEMQIAGK